MKYMTIWRPNGETERREYYPDGKMEEKSICNDNGYSVFRWDREGNPIGGEAYDRATNTQTILYPDGKVKIKYNRTTGEYEEFRPDGQLKRKGTWVNSNGTKAGDLRTSGSRFETGNMRAKLKDTERQQYNDALDAINELPPSADRKIAKETLVKAYKKGRSSR